MNTFCTEYFFPRKSPVNWLLPPEWTKKRNTEKNRRCSEAVSETTFPNAIDNASRDEPVQRARHRSFAIRVRLFEPRVQAPPRDKNLRRCDDDAQISIANGEREAKCRAHLSSPQPQLAESRSSWTFLRKYRVKREVQINVRRSERVGEIRAVFFTTVCAW